MQRTFPAPLGRAGRSRAGAAGQTALALAAVALLLPALSGCALLAPPPGDPLAAQNAYRSLKRTYTTALLVLAVARADGKIGDGAWEAIVKAKAGAQAIFDAVEADVAAGRPVTYASVLDALNTYVERLVAQQVEFNKKEAARVTRGSSHPGGGGGDPGRPPPPASAPAAAGPAAPDR